MCCCGGDAVNEDKLVLCCALCCVNLSVYPSCGCLGCSGKAGICCLNAEVCCKPGVPSLFPFCCLGLKPQCNGCSILNGQCHVCCGVLSCAIPCNDEVPVAVAVAGLTLYPKCGFCISQKTVMERD
ncbi:hypothetical protein FisN_17Hu171 [Fistulifera solaris]|uniref:Uncharacterized protein n=1 Tax=Fistulifera solaris TaxID=1519565 RepID=A0A1Z5JGV4_FISSO|nr:hypothetical protein FisN_17Hu171 [Fistulifera solaris]|eukprot:GAX13237.1 hypothetical protein FisN_17Hu171 [Fistulifera solaris]